MPLPHQLRLALHSFPGPGSRTVSSPTLPALRLTGTKLVAAAWKLQASDVPCLTSLGLFYRSDTHVARIRFSAYLPHLWPHHFKALGSPRVLCAAHASDEIERVAVEPPFFQVPLVDVNRDDFPDDQAAALGIGVGVENLIKLALKADWRLGHPPRPDHFRRRRGKFRHVELTDGRFIIAAGQVHSLAQFVGDHVDHKFPGLTNIPQRVFRYPRGLSHSPFLRRAHSRRERQQRRLDAYRVKK